MQDPYEADENEVPYENTESEPATEEPAKANTLAEPETRPKEKAVA
jgi:hypothetical protein